MAPDLPPRLTEHVHHLMGVTAWLFVARTVLLSTFYYIVLRQKLGHKLWQILRRHRSEAVATLATGILLTIPLALVITLERYLFRVEKNYILEGVLRLNEVDRLIRDNFPTFDEALTVVAVLIGYWLLDNFYELWALNRKQKGGWQWLEAVKRFITSRRWVRCFHAMRVKCRRKTGKIRRRVSSQTWYYVLFNLLAVTLMFTAISTLLAGNNQMSDKMPVAAMAESPLKARIQSLAEKAGVGPVPVYVAHVSGRTSEMNAHGRYRIFGTGITIYDTTLKRLSGNEFLFVVSHELYHVKQMPAYAVVVASAIVITLTLGIVFGTPRRRKCAELGELTAEDLAEGFTHALPRYLCVGVAAWLIFQGAACALKRWHEAEADRFAVRLTRDEAVQLDDVRTALTKINESGLNDPSPPYLFQMLFNDHPSLKERLRNVEAVSR